MSVYFADGDAKDVPRQVNAPTACYEDETAGPGNASLPC